MRSDLQRVSRSVFLAAAAFASTAAATEACSCAAGDDSRACEEYKRFDVAFVGRAILVPSYHGGGRVNFLSTQTIKGVRAGEVTVLNENSGIGCGYQFEEGELYIVFASRNSAGEIEIAPCSSTVWEVRPPDDAPRAYRRKSAEAVAFAESMRRPAIGGRIFGEVQLGVPFHAQDRDDDREHPVDGATILLQGSNQQYRTASVKGRYEFTHLQPGTYRVSVVMPAGFPPARSARPPADMLERGRYRWNDPHEDSRTVTIEDARSCGYAPFTGEFDGKVEGSIVYEDGSPARDLDVQILPAASWFRQRPYYGPTSFTDERGGYHFVHLPPGRYVVGINLQGESYFFPPIPFRRQGNDRPGIVELRTGDRVDLGALRIPPQQAVRQIAGTIHWSDGRPLGDVMLWVSDVRNARVDSSWTVFVLPDGAFRTKGLGGHRYVLTVEGAAPRGRWDVLTAQTIPLVTTTTMTIKVDNDRTDLVLVLEPKHR